MSKAVLTILTVGVNFRYCGVLVNMSSHSLIIFQHPSASMFYPSRTLVNEPHDVVIIAQKGTWRDPPYLQKAIYVGKNALMARAVPFSTTELACERPLHRA